MNERSLDPQNDPNRTGNSMRTAAPALWNPTAAAIWSVLFTPIFGAILHMKNWEALGQRDRAKHSMWWAVGCAVLTSSLLITNLLLPESAVLEKSGRLLGLALLFGWYLLIGRSQTSFVLTHLGRAYPRRGWIKPMLWAVVTGFIFVLMCGLLVTIMKPLLD